ncbi:MAG TPA: efflux RND transporter periplasmic adaptor subunit [Puia sp.]|nr:efflux RND transporter periplasmic adaptor subunit [Puia sp.]
MKNKRLTVATVTICAALTVGLLSGCSSSDGEEKKDKKEAPKTDSAAAPVATFELQKGRLSTNFNTPGELIAYQQVDLYAKENSFVKKLLVDVGSEVKEGQLLVTMEAPELTTQLASALSRVKSQEAIYIASKSNYDRLIETSKTPGTIGQNDIDQADARQKSDMAQWDAAKSAYNTIAETLKYLEIRAPFSGIITARNVNPGAYVGPSGKGSELPLFTLQEQKHLRLVVSVPEAFTGFLSNKDQVKFSVRALPNQRFTAKVNRMAGALDTRLRSERVEMDVYSDGKKLLPGMVAEVDLPMPSQDSTFLVPATAIVNSTERVFVIKVDSDRKAQWVDIKLGRSEGGKTEIYGDLKAGDQLVKVASEERRNGSPIH